MTKQSAQRLTQVIGLYQMLEGAVGLGFGLYLLIGDFRINIFFVFYCLLSIGLSSFCFAAGFFCFAQPSKGLTLAFCIDQCDSSHRRLFSRRCRKRWDIFK